MGSLEVGSRVLVHGNRPGFVRFIRAGGESGALFGVELDSALGNCDGELNGERYFRCKALHGVFVDENKIIEFRREQYAATLVQMAFRVYMARKKVYGLLGIRTWNILDAHAEEIGQRASRLTQRATTKLKSSTVVDHTAMSQTHSEEVGSSFNNHNDHCNPQEEPTFDCFMDDTSAMSDVYSIDNSMVGATIEELRQAAKDMVESLEPEGLLAINPSIEYTGTRLAFPLRLDSVLGMLESFRSGEILHFKYFMLILYYARKLFAAEKNLQKISFDGGVKLTVVGDLHGQLEDLYAIFTINGLPSENNWYLFNGDLVDRGPHGCEIVAIIFAFKILYPGSIFVNRGNHETRAQNAWMGFEEELHSKYESNSPCVDIDSINFGWIEALQISKGQQSFFDAQVAPSKASATCDAMKVFFSGDRFASLKLYTMCHYCFDALPICALVLGHVFVCHGGLWRKEGFTLDMIESINRFREPPIDGPDDSDSVYEDLLWSDPRPTATYPAPLQYIRASDRGAGCEFGSQVTKKFCANYNVSLIVRSHECVQEGYEVLHDGRLITVFSASRYCGTQMNKGAFITFGKDLQPEIKQYYACSVADESFVCDRERIKILIRDAVKMIVEIICDRRLDLYRYFTEHDTKHTGRCTKLEWKKCLVDVLQLDLLFLHYQKYLAEIETDGTINYSKFLSRFVVVNAEEEEEWQAPVIERICEKLYTLFGSDIENIFNKFETTEDGCVGYQEFIATLRFIDVGLDDDQIYELMRVVDVDKDGHIKFSEFSERFGPTFSEVVSRYQIQRSKSLVETETSAREEMAWGPLSPRKVSNLKLDWNKMDSWTAQVLKDLRGSMFERAGSLRTAWEEGFDRDGKGFISVNEFLIGARDYAGLRTYSDAQYTTIFMVIDTNNRARVNALEFFDAFRPENNNLANEAWKRGILQQVRIYIYRNQKHLRAAFRVFDCDNCGSITTVDFEAACKSITDHLASPITDSQIKELCGALKRTKEGKIDYKEFLNSFSIRDSSSSVFSVHDSTFGPDMNNVDSSQKFLGDEDTCDIENLQLNVMEVDD